MLIGRLLVYQTGDLYLQEHRELGYSLYDTHLDGSGVCYSSCLRPILNLRPKYASWLGAHGSGLWQFNADTASDRLAGARGHRRSTSSPTRTSSARAWRCSSPTA